MRYGSKRARIDGASVEEETVIVAFRRHTLLPLDDCLYVLQPTIPHLTLVRPAPRRRTISAC
jgi:hypothetical protein